MQNPKTYTPKTKYFPYFHTAHKFRSHAAQRNFWLFSVTVTDYVPQIEDSKYCTRRNTENKKPKKQTV